MRQAMEMGLAVLEEQDPETVAFGTAAPIAANIAMTTHGRETARAGGSMHTMAGVVLVRKTLLPVMPEIGSHMTVRGVLCRVENAVQDSVSWSISFIAANRAK